MFESLEGDGGGRFALPRGVDFLLAGLCGEGVLVRAVGCPNARSLLPAVITNTWPALGPKGFAPTCLFPPHGCPECRRLLFTAGGQSGVAQGCGGWLMHVGAVWGFCV
jgi:hypothetical protein